VDPSAIKINKAKAVTGNTLYRTTVNSRDHTIIIDEPEKSGGHDDGPTPHELLVGALASCVAITLRMYCERKGWKLNRVEVDAEMQRTTASGIQSNMVTMKISLDGNLDEEQRKRLLEISAKCPVHKTLNSSFSISHEFVS